MNLYKLIRFQKVPNLYVTILLLIVVLNIDTKEYWGYLYFRNDDLWLTHSSYRGYLSLVLDSSKIEYHRFCHV